jgi:integrase/recombinase XerD
VRRAALDLYARESEQAGRSRSTVARRLSTLSQFYRYAAEEGVIDSSPAASLKRPRVGEDSQSLGLDRKELTEFLRAAERAGVRDYALSCLLALNGLRVSEVCAADASDLSTERGHRVLKVTRKGGRKALIPVAPRTIAAVEGQLGGRTEGPLLLANDGQSRLDRFDVRRVVRRLARRAGINKHLSPHSLRHSFITAALDAGVPLRDVQDAAGHADPRTTRRYDRARHSLDRHATYAVAAYLSDAV